MERGCSLARALAPVALLALLLAAATGCTKSGAPKGTEKHPIVKAEARNLRLTADGSAFAFLALGQQHAAETLPEGISIGDLYLGKVESGAARKLGEALSTLDDAFAFSPDGSSIAWLASFNFRRQAGVLQLAALTGEPVTLGEAVRFYRFSPDSRLLAYVGANGSLKVRELESGVERALAEEISTFEFSPNSNHLLVRSPGAKGGTLRLLELASGGARELAKRVGEYGFAPKGQAYAFTAREDEQQGPYALFTGFVGKEPAPARRADEVSTFRFSPDGGRLAALFGQGVNRPRGDLRVLEVAEGEGRVVATEVIEYRWSPDSNSLAAREQHLSNKGAKWIALRVVDARDGAERLKEVSYGSFDYSLYDYSHDGRHFAYVKATANGSIDLALLDLAVKEPARHMAGGVFGFQFSLDDKEIYYRTACTRLGRECDLYIAPVAPPPEGQEEAAKSAPRRLAEGIWNFTLSHDGSRLLLTYPRLDSERFADLAWLEPSRATAPVSVDSHTLVGARFAGGGAKVVYIVASPKREGVYIAELR